SSDLWHDDSHRHTGHHSHQRHVRKSDLQEQRALTAVRAALCILIRSLTHPLGAHARSRGVGSFCASCMALHSAMNASTAFRNHDDLECGSLLWPYTHLTLNQTRAR